MIKKFKNIVQLDEQTKNNLEKHKKDIEQYFNVRGNNGIVVLDESDWIDLSTDSQYDYQLIKNTLTPVRCYGSYQKVLDIPEYLLPFINVTKEIKCLPDCSITPAFQPANHYYTKRVLTITASGETVYYGPSSIPYYGTTAIYPKPPSGTKFIIDKDGNTAELYYPYHIKAYRIFYRKTSGADQTTILSGIITSLRTAPSTPYSYASLYTSPLSARWLNIGGSYVSYPALPSTLLDITYIDTSTVTAKLVNYESYGVTGYSSHTVSLTSPSTRIGIWTPSNLLYYGNEIEILAVKDEGNLPCVNAQKTHMLRRAVGTSFPYSLYVNAGTCPINPFSGVSVVMISGTTDIETMAVVKFPDYCYASAPQQFGIYNVDFTKRNKNSKRHLITVPIENSVLCPATVEWDDGLFLDTTLTTGVVYYDYSYAYPDGFGGLTYDTTSGPGGPCYADGYSEVTNYSPSLAYYVDDDIVYCQAKVRISLVNPLIYNEDFQLSQS